MARAIPLRNLSGSLPAEVSIIELGYLASEVRATVNVDVQRNVCLPTIFDAVFEFAERDAWEGGTAEFLSLHELTANGEYYVFVTTPEGLYRYDMNDIVRVTGRVNETPTLKFVQKGKGVTNITGEKLHEDQVRDPEQPLYIRPLCQAQHPQRDRTLLRLFLLVFSLLFLKKQPILK